MAKEIYIRIERNGPYMLYGAAKAAEKIILTDANGISVKYGDGRTFEIKTDPVALCRCGRSKNAPFCDGSHARGFDGTETADKTPIMRQPSAEAIRGPELTLLDNQNYCAFARFCDRGGRIWNLVASGGNPKLAIEEANLCPAGRLLMFTKDGASLETKDAKEVDLIEDGGLEISGPLWIRGGIKVIGADGTAYEVRNKQTLCRCGASGNKPFCNGSHASIKWKAGYPKSQ
ncbi:MAG: CDGSH iron-sulfur domain-containing protein [Rickettsiales bacterium]|jgi:CDGSH-type Zn-finger protein|nr:CDGSH iron-sulfur domain-containing protein [Rickettsiales bacterium]